MLSLVFQASVPKNLSEQDANEDATSVDLERGIFAMSDGASESFDSQAWARLLVARFVEHPAVNPDWVDSVRKHYAAGRDFDAMSWSQQAAYERGSFATLLGVGRHENSHDLEIIAVGDSLAVHLDGPERWDSYPYRRAEQFDDRPRLLSTIAGANAFVASGTFNSESGTVWRVTDESTVLLMTDALGQWLLAEPDAVRTRADILLAASTQSAFVDFVIEQRKLGAMRVDDTTLLVLSIRDEGEIA